MLTVGMNHISEHLNVALNMIAFIRGCDLELKMELLKSLAIQNKISEVNLLMKSRI